MIALCAANPACCETRSYGSVLGAAVYGADGGGGVTRSWIDPNGKLVAVEDSQGVLARASFDARSRRTQSVDPDQGSWSFVSNGLDEMVSQTDARGGRLNGTYSTRRSCSRVRAIS